MKLKLAILLFFLIFSGYNAQAQFLKKLKKKAEQAAERTVLNKTDEIVSDKTEKTIDGVANGSSKKPDSTNSSPNQNHQNNATTKETTETVEESEQLPAQTKPIVWSKYNFVPGDTVIFDDDVSNEESGEFPSRWDLVKGSAENASLNGEPIINIARHGIITPLMNKKEYLPEVFTIEFDAYFDRNGVGYNSYNVRFWPGVGGYADKSGDSFQAINITRFGVTFNSYIRKQYRNLNQKKESLKTSYGWKHIAMAFNKRSLKIFIDEDRILNLPNLEMQPKQFSIEANFHNTAYIGGVKNIRIAEGGKKLYDRVMADGKFVTRGILFDVNKATIKPESMGVLNEVANMMQEHKDLNFRIEGHTDSDGSDQYNLKLSAERANAVKSTLISLGIAGNRFETEGKGESEPLADNTTPEGKANNRRVEFVKI